MEARFCGRVLSEGKVRYDPRNITALVEMRRPARGEELQQLLCASNWMRNAIQSYAELVAPLQTALDSACENIGKRTKRALACVDSSHLWGAEQEKAFKELKSELANSTSFAYPKDTHRICLFTDTNDSHWSAILVQCREEEMDVSIE